MAGEDGKMLGKEVLEMKRHHGRRALQTIVGTLAFMQSERRAVGDF